MRTSCTPNTSIEAQSTAGQIANKQAMEQTLRELIMYAVDGEEFDRLYEIYDRYRGEETPLDDKLAKAGEWLEQHRRTHS